MVGDIGGKERGSRSVFRAVTLDEITDGKGEAARRMLPVAIVLFLSNTVAKWAIVAGLGLDIRPLGLGLVAAAVAVGRPARWGSAVGLLAAGLLLGDWTGGVVYAISAYVATTLGVRLWARSDGSRDSAWSDWMLRYGLVAVGTAFAFIAMESWLFDVLGRAAFSVTVPRAVMTTVPFAVLGTPLVRPVARRATGTAWEVPGRPMSEWSQAIVVATVLGWTVLGYVSSALFRLIEQAPPGSIGRRISPALETFLGLWGDQGMYAELLLGLLALAGLAVVLRRARPTPDGPIVA